MKVVPKILIVLAVAGAIAGTLALKARDAETDSGAPGAVDVLAETIDVAGQPMVADAAQEPAANEETAKLPRLVDLGADKCIPCKAMAPILEELKAEYAGKFDVEFIDVWKNPDAGATYGVQMIPTQIFFDAEGKERFRHTGFFAKEDILAKWKELGVS